MQISNLIAKAGAAKDGEETGIQVGAGSEPVLPEAAGQPRLSLRFPGAEPNMWLVRGVLRARQGTEKGNKGAFLMVCCYGHAGRHLQLPVIPGGAGSVVQLAWPGPWLGSRWHV